MKELQVLEKAVAKLSFPSEGTPARLLAQLWMSLCQDDGAASEFQHRHILGSCALHSRIPSQRLFPCSS